MRLGFIPVNRDHSFKATVTVPGDSPAGDAELFLRGSAYDNPCQDTISSSSSCAGFTTYPDVTIKVAS